jgi:hypothetical protein
MAYRFEMVCPRCDWQAQALGDKFSPPPRLPCEACLLGDQHEVVEMSVVAVSSRDRY